MWSTPQSHPLLSNLQIPSIPKNPQTPNFGRINQFTLNGFQNPLKTTQQSYLLQDTQSKQQPQISSKRDKQKLTLSQLRTPLKQKKNLQVISSWNKQQIINQLILDKKTLSMKLERSQQQNKKLTTKLEQKCKQFDTIKVELATLKQNLVNQSKIAKEAIPRIDVVSTKEMIHRSSSSLFHSKRSSSDFQRQDFGVSSNRQNHFSHEKMFKDRLERVCKRLEVLEEEQNLIRYKNKIANNNSPYR